MEYGQPNTLSKIRDLERRVHQLEVSPRTGLAKTVNTSLAATSPLFTQQAGIWSTFSDSDVELNIRTGTDVLILFAADIMIVHSGKFKQAFLGVTINGVICDTTAQMHVYNLAVNSNEFTDQTVSNFCIRRNLTAQYNLFQLVGKYADAGSGTSYPAYSNRSLTVIPLDT